MVKLNEKGMWKTESAPKLGVLHRTANWVVKAKGKFWGKTPGMIRKQ
jgi:hypothetical protein